MSVERIVDMVTAGKPFRENVEGRVASAVGDQLRELGFRRDSSEEGYHTNKLHSQAWRKGSYLVLMHEGNFMGPFTDIEGHSSAATEDREYPCTYCGEATEATTTGRVCPSCYAETTRPLCKHEIARDHCRTCS